jgi:hypothetical protein
MKALLFLMLLAAIPPPPLSVVYARYKSGRPRLVVKATHDPDELLLLRFADARGARPRVIARQELDSTPGEVTIERVIDAKDVVVWLDSRHGGYKVLNRIVNDRFVRISDGFGEAIDLDGDGVPENIAAAYVRQGDCAAELHVWIDHWNAKRFVNDGRHYVTVLGIYGGSTSDEPRLHAEKRYAVHLFGPGRVTFDGKPAAIGMPFRATGGCHTIALSATSARTRAVLEELP